MPNATAGPRRLPSGWEFAGPSITFADAPMGWLVIVDLPHRILQKTLPNCAVPIENFDMVLVRPGVICRPVKRIGD